MDAPKQARPTTLSLGQAVAHLESLLARTMLDSEADDAAVRKVLAALSQPPAAAPDMVTISLETAKLIDGAFLPRNPNKMRGAHPDVVQAAHDFKHAVAQVPAAPPAPSSDLPPGLVLVATPYRDAPDKWMLIEMTSPGRAKVITGGYIETEAIGVEHAHSFRQGAEKARRDAAQEGGE